jgi:hypothetical protein
MNHEEIMRQRMRREAYDRFRESVLDAVAEYDKSDDHVQHGSEIGDCVRCNALVAIGYEPSWKDADRKVWRAHAEHVHARRNAQGACGNENEAE